MMQNTASRNKYNSLFLFLGIAIACYLLARAYYVDITDDEAWSFYNVKNFWWVETLCSGNTHWFNFLAIKAALILGFEKAWQIRWFSVLSGLTFLNVAYYWLKSLQGFSLKLFAFAFVFFNPYLLEYLTLARGYSTALCFLAISLALFIKAISNDEKRWLQFFSLATAGYAAIANFNFFYFFVVFCCIYFYRFYFHKYGMNFLKQKWFYADVIFAAGVAFFVLRALLFIKVCSNDIASFGGEEFVPAIFYSFIDRLFYGNIYLTSFLKIGLGWTLFLVMLLASVYGMFKLKVHNNSLYFYSSILLIGMFALVIFNKWVFNVLYPTDRTALMFYPLMTIVLVGFLQCISNKFSVKTISLYVLSVLLVLNFIKNFTLNWGNDHDYCHNVEVGFNYFNKVKSKKVGVTADLYFVFLKYYQHAGYSYDGEAINTSGHVSRYVPENKLEDFDYLLLRPPYNLSYYRPSDVSFESVKFIKASGLLIVKVHSQQK